MTQAPGALPTSTVLDYERTLILAIELSNTSWVLAAQLRYLACRVSKPSAPSGFVTLSAGLPLSDFSDNHR
jgi:hypothetical protein